MNAAPILVAALALTGCNLAERLSNGATVEPSGAVVEPSGEVIEPDGTVTPAPDAAAIERDAADNDVCLVRARHFHGLVRIPCDQIAREAAP